MCAGWKANALTWNRLGEIAGPVDSACFLVEDQAVTEGVGNGQVPRTPGHGFDARALVAVVPCGQFPVVGLEVLGLDPHGTARGRVPVVLGKVQRAVAAGNAEVQRRRVVEAVLEIDLEAQVVEIELAGLLFVEDAQDGYGRADAQYAPAE